MEREFNCSIKRVEGKKPGYCRMVIESCGSKWARDVKPVDWKSVERQTRRMLRSVYDAGIRDAGELIVGSLSKASR